MAGPRVTSPWLLALTGLIAGLCTVSAETFVRNATLQYFFVGLVFGVGLALYFVLYEGRSIGRALAFVAASTAAHSFAVLAAFAVTLAIPRDLAVSHPQVDIPLPALFVAGFCGALLIFVAAALLFRNDGAGRRPWAQLPVLAIIGGLLAIGGWATGSVLGRPLLLALASLHLRPASETLESALAQQSPQFLWLYVEWQFGVAFCLGLMLARPALQSDVRPVVPPAKRIPATAVLFFGGVLLFLGWEATSTFRANRMSARASDELKASLAEEPSDQNLPPLPPLTLEQALILESIGGWFPGEPRIDHRSGVLGDRQKGYRHLPPSATYSVRYVPDKDLPAITYQPSVGVSVQQYPNVEWARYKVKYPDSFNVALDDGKSLSTVTKFGRQIVMNTVSRYPNGDGRLVYLWSSGSVVIEVTYSTRDVNEDFLRRYLEKY